MKRAITITLLATALTPLFADAGVLSSFFSPKNLFFRLAVFISSVLFSLLLINQKEAAADIRERLAILFKNKTVFFSILTILLITASALFFAVDKVLAFWGEGARGEGAMELLFFGGFFILCALFLKEKDWKSYFKISMIVALILFCIELYQYSQGMIRPDSLFGNPIFLASYYLFSITAGLLLLKRHAVGADRFWNYLSGAAIALSAVGIFLTRSRGVILGMAVGAFALLIFFIINRKTEKKWRKISAGVLCALIIFGGIFFATRMNPLWQKIPGVNRIAEYSFSSDATTIPRIINTKEALTAVLPKNEKITRLLFGWGWDNYIFAWQKYYDPAVYRSDKSIFDRTHDKFVDLLVMGGALALAAFLLSLAYWLRDIFRGRRDQYWITAILLFWFVAYIVQNIFAFDTIGTYVVFYVLLAYTVNKAIQQNYENSTANKK